MKKVRCEKDKVWKSLGVKKVRCEKDKVWLCRVWGCGCEWESVCETHGFLYGLVKHPSMESCASIQGVQIQCEEE